MKNFKNGFLYGLFSMFLFVSVLFLIGAIKPWWAVNTKIVEKIQYVEIENELICEEPIVNIPKDAEQKTVSIGKYKLTAYCACNKCCGKTDGITATGTKATQGRTIAVDPKVIPYGSEVLIDGKTYIAEDCGGAIKENRIDVFFDSHEDALQFGVKFQDVYLVV